MSVTADVYVENQMLAQKYEQMKEELGQQVIQNAELIIYKEKYEDLVLDYNDINKEYDSLIKKEAECHAELKALRKETEHLSVELFDEANRMVRHEKKKNFALSEEKKLLQNELAEQKLIMKMYQHQLSMLKETVGEFENEVAALKVKEKQLISHGGNEKLSNILFAPTIQAFRHDLKFYHSFIEYVYANQLLFQTKSQPDYKDAYFFKRMLVEDIDPTLSFDNSHAMSFFQKKSVYNAVLNQTIRIEPYSSQNERFLKKAHVAMEASNSQNNADDIVFMSKRPCAMCMEDRNDTIEHARLYALKTNSKQSSPNLASRVFMANVDPVANTEMPICNYCLGRVRSVCNLLSFLNAIKMGMYQVDSKDSISSKRMYIELNRYKSKMYWARVGVVPLESFTVENIDFSEEQLEFKYNFSQLRLSPEMSGSPDFSSVSATSSPVIGSPESESYEDYKTDCTSVENSPIVLEKPQHPFDDECPLGNDDDDKIGNDSPFEIPESQEPPFAFETTEDSEHSDAQSMAGITGSPKMDSLMSPIQFSPHLENLFGTPNQKEAESILSEQSDAIFEDEGIFNIENLFEEEDEKNVFMPVQDDKAVDMDFKDYKVPSVHSSPAL